MNVLIWSPTTGWSSSNFSPHYYLFKTHYRHYGKYNDAVTWYTHADLTAEQAIEQTVVKPDAVFLGIYPWNKNILHDYIRYLEQKFPGTPVFMGGVELNFHNTSELTPYKNIIALIKGEGEVPLTDIINHVYEGRPLQGIPGVWVRSQDKFLRPEKEAPKIKYKGGIGPKGNDFFEVDYSYLIENEEDILADIHRNFAGTPNRNRLNQKYFFWESARGCPYGCVYCDWGGGINTKVRRKPQHVINKELEIIFKNLDNLYFHLVDANFGIFPQDIETAEHIAYLLKKYNKVGNMDISITFAKNNEDNVARVMEILNPVKSDMPWSLDIQSTDKQVLEDIKRVQQPISYLADKYKIKENNSKFYTNVMLALPGTTFEKDFKSWCDVLDAGSQISGYITTVPPQSEMLEPKFVKEWNVQTFKTTYEHATLNHLNYTLQNNAEIIHMYSCKSFSADDYVNILMVHELIQLIDGAYITKFARILANQNGYTSYDFYKPIVERFLNDKTWLGIDIDDIRRSIQDWMFNNQPFGNYKGLLFTDALMKKLIVAYYTKQLRLDLLGYVSHMHSEIESALDIGFRTLPVGKPKTFTIESRLKYNSNPACELSVADKNNTVLVTPEQLGRQSLMQIGARLMSPKLVDNIISNYRP